MWASSLDLIKWALVLAKLLNSFAILYCLHALQPLALFQNRELIRKFGCNLHRRWNLLGEENQDIYENTQTNIQQTI